MIIGIDASRANREQKTGVEWYTFHLIEEMKRMQNDDFKMQNGESVRVVLYSPEPLKGQLADLPENWESKVLRWPPGRLWTQLRLSWEMLMHPPDILFIPAHVFPLVHPKKTVMTIHDIAAAQFPAAYDWFERWYSLWSAKQALKKLWKIITPSEFTKNELIKTLKHKNIKTFVVPHGYDSRYRKIDDQAAIDNVLTRYHIKKPFILSVGRWEEKKNTTRIIQAFDQISLQLRRFSTEPRSQASGLTAYSLQLVLVGKPGHGYEKVKEAYEQSSHKDRILMPGYIDPADLVYIMNAAEVFIFPSLYEGFGLPVLEAMACGTPVVAGKGSSLEEIGGDACVYVDPLNEDDIARGINKIMQNGELRMQNVNSGLTRVKNFSWEKCARETLSILLNL